MFFTADVLLMEYEIGVRVSIRLDTHNLGFCFSHNFHFVSMVFYILVRIEDIGLMSNFSMEMSRGRPLVNYT